MGVSSSTRLKPVLSNAHFLSSLFSFLIDWVTINARSPARFIGKIAVTEDSEAAKIKNYLDTDKVADEALYDGKAEDARADQTDSDSADQRKTDFAASVGKPGDKCIQGKGEGKKRGLGDYP